MAGFQVEGVVGKRAKTTYILYVILPQETCHAHCPRRPSSSQKDLIPSHAVQVCRVSMDKHAGGRGRIGGREGEGRVREGRGRGRKKENTHMGAIMAFHTGRIGRPSMQAASHSAAAV